MSSKFPTPICTFSYNPYNSFRRFSSLFCLRLDYFDELINTSLLSFSALWRYASVTSVENNLKPNIAEIPANILIACFFYWYSGSKRSFVEISVPLCNGSCLPYYSSCKFIFDGQYKTTTYYIWPLRNVDTTNVFHVFAQLGLVLYFELSCLFLKLSGREVLLLLLQKTVFQRTFGAS